MRIPDLDKILSAMLKTYDGISDLNFSVGHPMQVEDYGELKPVFVDPPIDALTPYQTEQIALTLMQGNRRLIYDYLTGGSCDCSYSLDDEARFRVNIFRQQGHFSIVLRKLEGEIPTVTSLGLPPFSKRSRRRKPDSSLSPAPPAAARRPRWRRCSMRSTKTRRSTSSRWKIRSNSCIRRCKATFNQRELGHDFNNYPNGLRAALRQAPKVILVGEMRDRATVEVALMAAETGHLVLSTLHTVDAGQSINRILGFSPWAKSSSCASAWPTPCVTSSASDSRRKSAAAGNCSPKFLGNNLRTRETIAIGEGEHRSFYEIIEASSPFGWMTFDQSILNAYEKRSHHGRNARLFASRKGKGHPRHRHHPKNPRRRQRPGLGLASRPARPTLSAKAMETQDSIIFRSRR